MGSLTTSLTSPLALRVPKLVKHGGFLIWGPRCSQLCICASCCSCCGHSKALRHQGMWQAGTAHPYLWDRQDWLQPSLGLFPETCGCGNRQNGPKKAQFEKTQFSERPIKALIFKSWFCATYPLVEVGFQTCPVSVFTDSQHGRGWKGPL